MQNCRPHPNPWIARTAHGVSLRLVIEKLPLFALSAASCAITVVAQCGAMESLAYTSMAARIGNAAVSYVAYLGQMFWPANLAVIYPHSGSDLPAWQVAAALGVLAAISVGVAALRRRAPICWSAGCGISGCSCR